MLNPVLSAPPPIPFCHLGTLREKFLGMAVFQCALEDMIPLPQIVWDVLVCPLDVGRHRPSVPVLRSDVDEEAGEEGAHCWTIMRSWDCRTRIYELSVRCLVFLASGFERLKSITPSL